MVWSLYNHHVNANATWYAALNDTPGRVGPPIGKPADIEAMMRYAAETFGRVDILVNNAGIQHVAKVEDFPPERAVNWFPPQDSVIHFADGKATVYPAGAEWDE